MTPLGGRALSPNDAVRIYHSGPICASANPSLINGDLEMRLLTAFYLRIDDPDSLTEDEHRDNHRITKILLLRLVSGWREEQCLVSELESWCRDFICVPSGADLTLP